MTIMTEQRARKGGPGPKNPTSAPNERRSLEPVGLAHDGHWSSLLNCPDEQQGSSMLSDATVVAAIRHRQALLATRYSLDGLVMIWNEGMME